MTKLAYALVSDKWAAIICGKAFIKKTKRKDIKTYLVKPASTFFSGMFSRVLSNWEKEIYQTGN